MQGSIEDSGSGGRGSARRARLTVEVAVGHEPIQGVVADGRGPGRPFLGWLDLASALEAARMPARSSKNDQGRR